MDVAAWLRGLGLEQYAQLFRDNDIDGEIVCGMTAEDLKELGISSFGHRRRLFNAITALGGEPPTRDVDQSTSATFARTSPPPIDAERRQLTVMFCDLVGSTALSVQLDPEDLSKVIRSYQSCVASTIARFDGFIARYVGDGVLIYFGWPEARETDAELAIRGALAIIAAIGQSPALSGLRVRVGIATGLVVIGEPIGSGEARQQTAIGETPNLAARLQALAKPDTVVISASTRRQIGGLFETEDLGEQRLAGFGELQRAWRVLGESGVVSRFEALRPEQTALVGREEELDILLRRWQLANAGNGRVVLVSGEPGIGKSRLTAALSEQIGTEPHTRLRYFCSPHHQNSALYPVIAQLERAAGFERDDGPEAKLDKLETLLGPAAEIGDVSLLVELLSVPGGDRIAPLELSPQRKKERTFAALLRQLEGLARTQPVLIIFEDLHWIDPTSREFLDLVLTRIDYLPVLLAATFRPEFRPPWTGRAGTGLIALARLSRRDSETLAERVTTDRALSREVLERITQADGVPLFIEELTKAVLEASDDPGVAARPLAVPATLQASLMARLDRLPAGRQVAQIGAVIGREFSHALLAALALLPEAQLARGLEELTASGLALRRGAPPDAVYTFNHALTRDVAYAGVLKGRRRTCHHRIATVLKDFDDGYIEATEPELLAHHFQEAEDVNAAFAHWILAGDVAERHGANREALAHYRCAQRLSERAELSAADRTRIPELLMKLGSARMQVAGYHSAEALQCYREARDLALALDQQDEAAEAGIRMAPFLFGSCRHRDVIEIGNTILSGDTSRLRPETLVHVWVMMGGANYHAGAFEESLACSEKAVELDDQVNCTHKAPWAAADPAIVARDYVEMVARLMGNFDRSLAISEQSMAIALDRGHLFSVVWASVSRVSALRSFGRYAEAVACADRAMEICEKYGFEARIGNVLLHRGPALFDLGSEARGLADLQRGIALWRRASGIFMLARNMTLLADYQLRANQLEQARASLTEAEHHAETTEEKDQFAEIFRLRGRIWQREGNHEQARLCFECAIVRSREQRARLFELYATRDLASLRLEAGSAADSLKRLRALVDWFPAGLDIPVLAECRALLQ